MLSSLLLTASNSLERRGHNGRGYARPWRPPLELVAVDPPGSQLGEQRVARRVCGRVAAAVDAGRRRDGRVEGARPLARRRQEAPRTRDRDASSLPKCGWS